MNIIERIRLIRPQLNVKRSANLDVRHAGDILSGIDSEGSRLRTRWLPGIESLQWSLPTDSPFISPKSLGTYTKNDIIAKARIRDKREAERAREDFVGQGAYGTIYSNQPGLVRKEMTSPEALEELNAQAIGAELGLAPRVVAYESAVHGDPNVKGIVMQDLNAPGSAGTPLYKPLVEPGKPTGFVEDLTNPWSSTKDKLFALKHYKQMGQLALKGVDLKDRHTGNIFKHEMTGRPMQIDFGMTSKVSGEDQVQALIEATQGGFTALGQYDIAEIINDTAYDYLAGGQIKEAWDFTKEAFASLQKIKNPVALPTN